MTRIILADNQYITNAGLKYLLQTKFSLFDFDEVDTKIELTSLLNQTKESFIIVDYKVFDFESVNDIVILQQRFNYSNWILFSDSFTPNLIKELIYNTDRCSILFKDSSRDELILAIKEVLKGKRYISSDISNLLLTDKSTKTRNNVAQSLTLTEVEILKEMALGKSTKEIASFRHLSIHTVMTHRKNIFRKIEVNTIHEATKYAMRAGIVDLAEYYI